MGEDCAKRIKILTIISNSTRGIIHHIFSSHINLNSSPAIEDRIRNSFTIFVKIFFTLIKTLKSINDSLFFFN